MCSSIYARSRIFKKFRRYCKEANTLSDIGCREIILLGQNVNAYHGVNKNNIQISLAKLVMELEKIEKIDRISYTTSHPNDMTEELIELT